MAIKQAKLFEFGKGLSLTPGSAAKKERGFAAPERSLKAEVLKDARDEPPFYIRGRKAASRDEYWCSINLERIEKITGWTWQYQVPVYGGRDLAGGNVVDFLVHTPGMWTMLEPMSPYHHTGRHEDRYQMEDVARKKNWILVAWFTDEVNTLEMQYQFLRRELHL